MSSSSSFATPPPERDQQLLDLGKQCSHSACFTVDFLPFKCHHCTKSFCQDHFKVEDHKCPSYDEHRHNRVAPNCPLCNVPVAIAPGQDPNIRMDQHLERECSVVVGKRNASSTPRCKKATCNKVLFAPIKCDKCRLQFCAAHRFPGDHTCNPSAAPARPPYRPFVRGASAASNTGRPNTTPPSMSLNLNKKEMNAKASAAGTAALGAIQKSFSATSAAISQASNNVAQASNTAKLPGPFNKVDRNSVSPAPAPATVRVSPLPPPTDNTTTTTTTTTIATTTTATEMITLNVPPHIIDGLSFMPPPIFANA